MRERVGVALCLAAAFGSCAPREVSFDLVQPKGQKSVYTVKSTTKGGQTADPFGTLRPSESEVVATWETEVTDRQPFGN